MNLRIQKNKINDLYWLIKQVKKDKYKFSNYQEIIVSKGKGKEPRIISKSTVRDSIVLYTLKEYFKKNIEGSISVKANDIIQNIIEHIKDIKNIEDYIFFIKQILKIIMGVSIRKYCLTRLKKL